jgi:hypothetical protein
MSLSKVIEDAKALSLQLNQDVRLASTRVEHIRVTARAVEAENIVASLIALQGESDVGEESEASNG